MFLQNYGISLSFTRNNYCFCYIQSFAFKYDHANFPAPPLPRHNLFRSGSAVMQTKYNTKARWRKCVWFIEVHCRLLLA